MNSTEPLARSANAVRLVIIAPCGFGELIDHRAEIVHELATDRLPFWGAELQIFGILLPLCLADRTNAFFKYTGVRPERLVVLGWIVAIAIFHTTLVGRRAENLSGAVTHKGNRTPIDGNQQEEK